MVTRVTANKIGSDYYGLFITGCQDEEDDEDED